MKKEDKRILIRVLNEWCDYKHKSNMDIMSQGYISPENVRKYRKTNELEKDRLVQVIMEVNDD